MDDKTITHVFRIGDLRLLDTQTVPVELTWPEAMWLLGLLVSTVGRGAESAISGKELIAQAAKALVMQKSTATVLSSKLERAIVERCI